MGNYKKNTVTKKVNKKIYIIIASIVIILLVSAAFATKAGLMPNYLNLDILCPNGGIVDDGPTLSPNCLTGDCDMTAYKPVIYLYPQQEQLINVKINYQGNLIFTYPQYNNGWNVKAYPDGKLINQSDNKEYSYLFWEGIDSEAEYDLSSGFIVKGSDTVRFLQETLSNLGLTAKEYNEFIVYWLPKMLYNDYNLIHFASKQEYDDKAVLDITPVPDSVLRVFMVFKKLDNNHSVKVFPQSLSSFNRVGFSVVEWGGTEIE